LISSVCIVGPVAGSHSLTVLFFEADASSLPSGEKIMAQTGPE
jgi:hypothetical protein